MKPDLNGKVAVVTGASRGIGRAVAEHLAVAGAHVILASRDEGALNKVEAAIIAGGGSASVVTCDVSDPEQVEAMFTEADRRGSIDILVCAAGVLAKAPVADMPDETWRSVVGTNVDGVFFCCRRAMRSMTQSGGGTIITFSSLSGVYGTEKFPGMAAYNVSKYGVIGLTEAIGVEGRDLGIVAMCVSPGAVETQMLKQANPDLVPGLVPDDVGRFVVALLDPDLRAASGANILLFSNR